VALNTNKEVARLQRMTAAELRREYAKVTGEEIRSRHKGFLVRRIIWWLQARGEGGLSERARRRAKELAAESDVRITAPRRAAGWACGLARTAAIQVSQDSRLPMPGAVIVREYKGQTIEVRVLPKGFEYAGEVYRTLSAVAKAVTGTHWNGYHFFKLGKKGGGNGQRNP